MPIIECKNISMSYDGVTVFDSLSFSVESGDYLCIVGENGSGKSTLMKGLLGLKPLKSGEIIYSDGLKKTEIGYLPQQTGAQKDFPASVYEVVLSGRLNKRGLAPFYSRADKKTALDNMEKLGIASLKNRCYRELSGGQQQRVLLARALCATSKLLILDEPVTGLDPLAASEMYDIIKTLNEENGITVIMVSHDIVAAVDKADHILHLSNKELFFGTTADYTHSEMGSRFLYHNCHCDGCEKHSKQHHDMSHIRHYSGEQNA
ncbi:MAG: metal ABC transporter ATP-binding protein [Acutalibacteraceae bacterium]